MTIKTIVFTQFVTKFKSDLYTMILFKYSLCEWSLSLAFWFYYLKLQKRQISKKLPCPRKWHINRKLWFASNSYTELGYQTLLWKFRWWSPKWDSHRAYSLDIINLSTHVCQWNKETQLSILVIINSPTKEKDEKC